MELKSIKPIRLNEGDTFCGYELVCKLSEDGLGEVFLALKSGEQYRLRVFSPALTSDTGRKTRLLAALDDAREMTGGAIPVVDFGTDGDTHHYSVQKFVPGVSFQDIFESDLKLNENQVCELLQQLLRALRDVHSQQLVHGSLSLTKIIIDNNGRVLVHDVGLWDILRDENFVDMRNDHPEILSRIFDLMSPEVARGEMPKMHSDIFSAGAAALMLFTHRPLSSEAELAKALSRRARGKIASVSELMAGMEVSDDFIELLSASLSADSNVRFQTTRAFITALTSVNENLNPSADTLSPALTQKLIRKARSSNRAFNSMPGDIKNGLTDWHAVTGGNLIERTRIGQGDRDRVEDTVVESHAQTGFVGDLVKENNAPDAALSPFDDRAVTTQMDPVEASPTTEMDAVRTDERNKLGTDLSNFFEDFESFSDEEFGDDFVSSIFGEKRESSFFGGSQDQDQSDDVSELLDYTSSDDAQDLEKKTVVEEISSKDENLETNSKEVAGIEKVEPVVEEAGKIEKVVVEAPKKDDEASKTENRSNGRESAEESAETESIRENPDPHKRISKKHRGSEEDDIKRCDVLIMASEKPTNSKESRRIKRRKRREQRDIVPKAEVVEAEVTVGPMIDPENRPDYEEDPGMTATGGFVCDDDGEGILSRLKIDENALKSEDDLRALVASSENNDKAGLVEFSNSASGADSGEEDTDDFEDWTREARRPRSKTILILCICVLLLAIVGLGGYAISMHAGGSTPTANEKIDTDAQIALFKETLAKHSKADRDKATQLLKELSSSDVEQSKIAECRNAYAKSFLDQANTLKPLARTSASIPELMIGEKLVERTNALLTDCVNNEVNTQMMLQDTIDPELNSKAQAMCDAKRDEFKAKAESEARSGAAASLAELKSSLAAWREMDGIYNDVKKVGRKNSSDISSALAKSSSEIVLIEKRISELEAFVGAGASNSDAAASGTGVQAADSNAAIVAENETALANEAEAAAQAQAESAAEAQAEAEAAAQAQAEAAAAAQAQAEAAAAAQAQAKAEAAAEAQAEARAQAEQQKAAEAAEAAKAAEAKAAAEQQKAAEAAQAQAEARAQAEKQKAAEAAKAAEAKAAAEKQKTAEAKAAAANSAKSQSDVSASKLIADAQKLLSQKKFDDAIQVLKQATGQEPSNARAWFVMGRAYDAQNNTAKALDCAKKACSLDKKAQYEIFRGDMLVKFGDKAGAKEAYQKAISLGGNSAQIESKINAL